MSTEENKDTVSESKKDNSAQTFDIKEFLGRAWDAKYWIILSILVCCGYMYYRYKREAPVYTSNAELMFLFPNSGSSQGSATLAALRDLGTTATPGDINMFNEMEIFHSPTLMANVVKRLNLNTTYTTDGFGYMHDLYGKSPVIANFLDLPGESSASFSIRKSGEGHIIASNFVLNGQPMQSAPLRIPLNTVVESPIGKISISPTTNFTQFPEVIYINRFTVDSMAASMSSSIKTARKDEISSIMILSYSDVNATRANDVVNALIDAYTDSWVEEKSRSAVNTSNFIK